MLRPGRPCAVCSAPRMDGVPPGSRSDWKFARRARALRIAQHSLLYGGNSAANTLGVRPDTHGGNRSQKFIRKPKSASHIRPVRRPNMAPVRVSGLV
jgi:hypothetical protein